LYKRTQSIQIRSGPAHFGTTHLVRHYVRTDLIERKLHVLRSWDERLQDIVAGREGYKVVRFFKTG